MIIKFLALVFTNILLINITSAIQTPYFGDVILLDQYKEELPMSLGFISEITDDYVVSVLGSFAISGRPVRNGSVAQWNLPDELTTGDILQSSNLVDEDILLYTGSLDNTRHRFVVWDAGEIIQIYDLPDLELIFEESTSFDRFILYDSYLLQLRIFDTGLVRVTNIPTNETNQISIPQEGWVLVSELEDGWVLTYQSSTDTMVVMRCDFMLENCTHQEISASYATHSLDGASYLLIHSDTEGGRIVEIWRLNSDDLYEPTGQTIFIDTEGSRLWQLFADSLTYFYTDKASGSSQIWNMETGEQVHAFRQCDQIIALPDQQHFVHFDWCTAFFQGENDMYLNLYEIENPEPIDRLALHEIEGFENLQQWVGSEFTYLDISDNGERLLVNLGGAGVIVEIEYE